MFSAMLFATVLTIRPPSAISQTCLELRGELPYEFANLTYLQEIDFSVNYLNGSFPKAWKTLPLVTLSLLENNIKGLIPKEIADIVTLENLLLSGNNFTRTLPATFANLKNLTDFRINGTNISGPIPDFIGNWTKINRLDMQGTSMAGPIPSTIFHLKNMTELRVSDLVGPNMPFPDLGDMSNMVQLVLRNCLINGSIPPNIGDMMPGLKNLDLSFNRLTGDVQSLQQIPSLLFIDLSYNNFTGSSHDSCQDSNLNKISNYSLFINCGGLELIIKGEKYEADLSPMGPSSFFSYSDKWACSSTGDFVGSRRANYYTQASPNMTDTYLYSTARISPLSFKYHGLCLRSGNYKVKLHFAEIMFPFERRVGGIGTRIFDVSIQIHLYWAGKGTTFISSDIVYGPLISAIAVTPNFDPNTGHISVGEIAGIVAALSALLLLVLAVLWKKNCLWKKDLEDKELRELLQAGYYTLRQIKAATKNFAVSNKIGEGGFGPVYKGILPDGSVIAVKQLSAKSKQGNREFVNEIGMISAPKHPNLVNLFGCCVEGNQLLLIYEYMENNSLARAIFGSEEQRLYLNWPTRLRICLDIAKGLAYLHEESRLKIVHRDIKPTNILLDKDLTAKISDFGLAKLDEEENTHISTRIAGTIGYMAPEYAMRGYLTYKADVFSFGIVALEIVSGKSITKYKPKDEFIHLLDWAYVLKEQGNLLDLVDPVLESNYSTEEVLRMLNAALLCTNPSPSLRPLMSAVVGMLEGRIPVPEPLASRRGLGISYDSQTHTSTSSLETTQTESKSLIEDQRQVNRCMSPYSDQEEQEEKETS
ncbi:hypothetical protein C5167_013236 [Papaver somniferum]|uniref:non-specific serine/threonine protein kinase n=1 Tax=Papaver somniferum TaxID=3469 RepID=A0A4Y7J1N8_PAPSO|nr:hypothetical protein C5167_013236 [Papaver somniferum]